VVDGFVQNLRYTIWKLLRAPLFSSVAVMTLAVGIGLVGAFGLTRLMESLLFGVSPMDPVTFGSVALALLMVALLASYLPARRASRVDLVVALKAE
jgi:ABC-type antimicrobial peptide transport system permease subunit